LRADDARSTLGGPCRRRETLERRSAARGCGCAPTEEHDRVLDVLRLEPPQRLEVLGEDANGTGFFAFEKLVVEVR
jgi:hypothetical protein